MKVFKTWKFCAVGLDSKSFSRLFKIYIGIIQINSICVHINKMKICYKFELNLDVTSNITHIYKVKKLK